MAWEQRHGGRNRYYYRGTVGPDGKVHKTYFGNGAAAEQAYEEDCTRLDEVARVREQSRALLDAALHVSHELDQLIGHQNTVLAVALTAAGYHYHRGEWRRRRHGRQPGKAT